MAEDGNKKIGLTKPDGIDPSTGEPHEPIVTPAWKRKRSEELVERTTRGAQDVYGENWSDRS